jgi:hypothetical protein
MMDDPIVAEVRAARDAYARQFNYDLDAICRDLQQKQRERGTKVVSFPPRRPTAFTSSEAVKRKLVGSRVDEASGS